MARSWTPDTRINGRTFGDAPLVPGDVLSIGPVDFLVLQTPAMPRRAESKDRRAGTQEDSPGAAGPDATMLGRSGLRKAGLDHVRPECPDEETPPHGASGPDPQQQPPPPAEEADDSIDQYMAGLLHRVRQNAAELCAEKPCVGVGAASPEPEPDELGFPAPGVFLPSGSGQVSPWEPDPRPARPQAARVVVPETAANLAALRELANFSAKAALDRHSRRRLISLSTGKLILALAALACGGLLMGSWWFLKPSDLALYGGAVGLLAAVVWGLQHTILTGRILVGRSGRLQWGSAKDKPPADQEPSAPGAPPAEDPTAA